MTSDDLLDGKAGPEAQANEIFLLVSAMITEAVAEVGRVYPGNPDTLAIPGFPVAIIKNAS